MEESATSSSAAADARGKLHSLPTSSVAGPELDTIDACFRWQVERRGQAPAIWTRERTWTYAQLDGWANHLAARLPWTDGPQRVAVLAPQGAEAIAACLGVLKAGHAFIPLDPSHPAERNRAIVECARVAAILAMPLLFDQAADLAPHRPVVPVDPREAGHAAPQPGRHREPDDLAYVLFTSGSTGRPKGVMQPDRNLLHFVRSYASSLRITEGDRLTVLFSPAFSAILMDVFGGLLSGATLYPYDVRRRGLGDLPDVLDEHALTIYHSAPTLFRRLCESLPEGRVFEAIRIVDLGGEPVFRSDFEHFRAHFSADCVLVNHLASTEASVMAQYFVDRDTSIETATLPSGFAGEAVQLEVVDDRGRTMATGEVGQLRVHCAYGSPGYYDDSAATDASFFEDDTGRRVYQPGDLARFDEQGRLWHMGRDDSRVKVRGHTVELGEVEAALRQLDDVADAAVIAREPARGEPTDVTIHAFVALQPGATIGVAALHFALRAHLPEFMLPTTITALDALPLTPTGKLDRRALTPPAGTATTTSTIPASVLEPRNDVERALARIWRRLLGTDRIGVRDDFFESGGDSLQALGMLLEIEREFGKRLPLYALAHAGTIELLAPVVARSPERTKPVVLVAMQPHGDAEPLFLVPGLGGHPLRYGSLVQRLGVRRPVYSFQFPGLYGECEPLETIEAIAETLLDQVLAHQADGPYFLAGYSVGGIIAMEMARRLRGRGKRVAMLAMFDAFIPGWRGSRMGRRLRRFSALRPLEQVRVVSTWLGRRCGWIDALPQQDFVDSSSALYAGLERVLKQNRRAGRRYRPTPYDGSIDLFRAQAESFWAVPVHLSDYGWGALTGASVTVYSTPGDHCTMIAPPFAKPLAEGLARCIDRCAAG